MSGMTGGDITTLTGNAGGLIPASGSGNFNIVGSGTIVVTGAPATHTLTISGGGVTGMTEHAMVVGNAAGGITSLAVATDGQLPIGSTGNNPVLATLTAGNNIGITNAAGSITIKVNGTTNHTLQVGNATGDLTSLAVGATGTILTGVTGADPTWTTATYPSTVTKGDVLVASANNVVSVVNDVVNAGYVLTANAAAAPSFQALPAGVTYASDAETIAGTVTNKAVAPSNLKAKLGTQTLHGLPIGASDSVAIAWTAEPTDGQILIGKTGNQPVLATISSGNNITATAGAGTISIAVTGTTQHAVQVGGAAGQLASLAVGTTGKYLRAVTTADPAWSTLTLPDTVTKGDVLVASADNVVGSVAGATTAGHVLMANGAGSAPTFQALPAAGILSVSGTANQITASTVAGAVTLSTPSTFIAPGTIASTTTNTAGTDLISTAGNLKLPTTSSTVGQILWNNIPYIHAYGGDGLGGIYDSNIFVGKYAGNFTMTTGVNFGGNVGIGYKALNAAVSAGSNLALGTKALVLLKGSPGTSGNSNVALGNGAGSRMIGDSGVNYGAYFNLLIGSNAGYNLTASEYSNIYLNSEGNAGENGYLRIGAGTAANDADVLATRKIQKSYICGIYGKTPGGTLNVALIDSNDQLGSVASLGVAQGGTGAATMANTNGVNYFNGTSIVTTTVGTAGHVLTSNGAGSAPTFQALPSSGIQTLAGDSGTATGATVTIAGGTGITTSATSATVTITNSLPMNIANVYSSANNAMAIGYNALAGNATRGTSSVVIGDRACGGLVGGSNILHSTLIGVNIGLTLGNYAGGSFDYNDLYGYNVASGNDLHQNNFKYNCLFGSNSAHSISSTEFLRNSFFGYNTGGSLNNNQYNTQDNTFIGANSGATMTYGDGISYNTFIGSGSGNGYPAAANTGSCICIGYNASGSAAETNVLRIGNATGTSSGNLNSAFIAGIYGRTPSGTLNVALIDSNNQLGSVASLGVAQGGTGAATLTDHGILLGSGTGAITPLGSATDGQLPIGSSGADPVLATLTAGTGISVTNGAGSISIAATGTILAWAEETGATKTIVVQEAYVANRGTLITFTLPATAALGTEFKIQGKGAGGWKIAQNAGQTIHVGSSASTTGAAGYIASTDTYDAITLVCITADTDWAAESIVGNITIA